MYFVIHDTFILFVPIYYLYIKKHVITLVLYLKKFKIDKIVLETFYRNDYNSEFKRKFDYIKKFKSSTNFKFLF